MDDANRSRLSLYLSGTKMYHDIQRTFQWPYEKIDIGVHVSKRATY